MAAFPGGLGRWAFKVSEKPWGAKRTDRVYAHIPALIYPTLRGCRVLQIEIRTYIWNEQDVKEITEAAFRAGVRVQGFNLALRGRLGCLA